MTPFERLLSDVEGGLHILADIDMEVHRLGRIKPAANEPSPVFNGYPVHFESIQHLLERCKNAILALAMDQKPPAAWTFLNEQDETDRSECPGNTETNQTRN